MTWNTDPCGIAFATVMRPPCDFTMDRQIESPMPMLSDLVVKNASKIRLALSGSIPVPEVGHFYQRSLIVFLGSHAHQPLMIVNG